MKRKPVVKPQRFEWRRVRHWGSDENILRDGNKGEGAENDAVEAGMEHVCRGVVVRDTTTFRTFASRVVGPRDYVVEIGSSFGVCTAILAKATGSAHRVVGVEKSKSVVKEASKRYPGLKFKRLDVIMQPDGLERIIEDLLSSNGDSKNETSATTAKSTSVATTSSSRESQSVSTATQGNATDAAPRRDGLVIFIDIGGNREFESVSALILWLMFGKNSIMKHDLKPRAMVVKSMALYDNDIELTNDGWKQLSRLAGQAVQTRRRVGVSTQNATEVNQRISDQEEKAPNNDDLDSCVIRIPKQAMRKFNPWRMPERRTPEGVSICRFHNYDVKKGCLKGGERCPFDHDHCHNCLVKGHKAFECPSVLRELI